MSFCLAFPYLLLLFINKYQYQVLSFIYIYKQFQLIVHDQ